MLPGNMVSSNNPLYRYAGFGFVQQVREGQAKVEFRPTLFSSPPYLTESKILNIDELEEIRTPVERLLGRDFEEPWRFELKQRAAHLLVSNRDGQLSDARTDLLPHQISVANAVVVNPRKRFLIADEVGLGKTIETGMIIYALKQRGLANRVLIITPAGLTLQWQEEMKDKFGLDFVVYKEDVQGVLAFEANDHVVASIDTIKLDNTRKKGRVPGHKSLVLGARDWSLLVFDEAHKLSAKTWSEQKIEKTLNFRLAEELGRHCDALLLLTGTPHQGDDSKFQNLIKLLDENVSFGESFQDRGASVHYTELVLRNQKSKVTDSDGNPIFKGMEIHPVRVNLSRTGESAFHKELESYLREGYGYADQDPVDTKHKAIGFVMTTFQKLAASSTAAIKHALRRRVTKLMEKGQNKTDIRESDVDARFEGENQAAAVDAIADQFTETELGLIEDLLFIKVAEDGKRKELFNIIDSCSKDDLLVKLLIFTEYRETQDFVCRELQDKYGDRCSVIIRGGMNLWEKKRSQEAFRDDPRVKFLVSTEAGGEGINLQFCHILINYDLPWNPFRLAQRYGRLYRHGQDKVVQIFNLQNNGTIEERVRQYLEQKTETAAARIAKITGEKVQEIEQGLLGLYEEFLDYEKIYREGLAKGDLKPSKNIIDKGVKKAEEAYRIAFTSLFSKDISPFNPDRFRNEIKSALTLDHVEQFVTESVRRHGRTLSKSPEGTFEFLLPNVFEAAGKLQKRYSRVTFDRKIAIRHSEMEFMALGHPFTNAAINFAGSVELGGFCVSRQIKDPVLAGLEGIHFNFSVKLTKTSKEQEYVYFDLVPVFITFDGVVKEKAGKASLISWGAKAIPDPISLSKELAQTLYERARSAVAARYQDQQIWEEDIFCLNLALTKFV